MASNASATRKRTAIPVRQIWLIAWPRYVRGAVGGFEIKPYLPAILALIADSGGQLSPWVDPSITLNGGKSFGQLTDESHDAAWSSVDENSEIPVEAIARDTS